MTCVDMLVLTDPWIRDSGVMMRVGGEDEGLKRRWGGRWGQGRWSGEYLSRWGRREA